MRRAPSLVSRTVTRRDDTVYQRRFDERERRIKANGAARCPDCNAALVSAIGIKAHKNRGGCVVIPGAREKLATKIVEFLMGTA